jgi:membrane-bound serine protease (ClpP class)
MRRLLTALVMLATVATFGAIASPAAAKTAAPAVTVIQVEGTIDPILADFIRATIREADGPVAIQLNSTRGVLAADDLRSLSAAIGSGNVGVWVGPAKEGRARGQARELFVAAKIRAVAPGAQVEGNLSGDMNPGPVNRAPTLGDFLVDAMNVPSKVIRQGGRPHRQPAVPILFAKPALVNRMLHATANPSVPYFLVVSGMLLLLFEFYSVGIGLAAGAGLLALLLSAYGFGVLPTRPGGLLLLVLAMFGFAVDLQAGAPRFWTVVGAAAFLAGSFTLYAGMTVPLIAVVIVLAGTALFIATAMPAVMRARFSTPTIGRESMLGEMGVAKSAVNPDGTVVIRGAPWRARTNRATPIAAGDRLRVVGIDGLVLEVEPESGGAKDYRH